MNIDAGQPGRHLLHGLGVALLAFALSVSAAAGAQPNREYVVKAAFLFNFAKFIDWPDEAYPDAEHLGLCVFGEDPFDSALTPLAGKSIRGRTVAVTLIERLEDARGCQLMFVSPSEQHRLEEIFAISRTHNLLTVSDIKDFAELGGVIGLVTVNDKVRFEVNLGAARSAGLNISSKLLRLARVIDAGA